MPSPIYPNLGALFLADTISAALVNCKLKLYQNDFTPVQGTVIADMTVATFSGYAVKTIAALLASYLDPAGGASAQIATQQWDHNGGVIANTIYGFWLEDASVVPVLVMAGRFDAPVPMAALGDSLPLDVKLNFGAP